MMNEEEMLDVMREAGRPLQEVTDAMHDCRDWFEREGIAYTAADLLTMARMVMKREGEIADAAKRAKWERRHEMEEPA